MRINRKITIKVEERIKLEGGVAYTATFFMNGMTLSIDRDSEMEALEVLFIKLYKMISEEKPDDLEHPLPPRG
jgi:hypothetical protein